MSWPKDKLHHETETIGSMSYYTNKIKNLDITYIWFIFWNDNDLDFIFWLWELEWSVKSTSYSINNIH